MSVTEWVLTTYRSSDKDLEESKNLIFIWGLFENQFKNYKGNLDSSNFKSWMDSLDITQQPHGICIEEPTRQNSIDGKLVADVNKAFNHFYQLYINDSDKFINHVYNQTDRETQNAKARFLSFVTSIDFDKRDIRDKFVFLFHIAKRMRNKFFHGVKLIGEIKSEQREFKKINEYLIAVLSLIEKYN